jgi:hypothetical protein
MGLFNAYRVTMLKPISRVAAIVFASLAVGCIATGQQRPGLPSMLISEVESSPGDYRYSVRVENKTDEDICVEGFGVNPRDGAPYIVARSDLYRKRDGRDLLHDAASHYIEVLEGDVSRISGEDDPVLSPGQGILLGYSVTWTKILDPVPAIGRRELVDDTSPRILDEPFNPQEPVYAIFELRITECVDRDPYAPIRVARARSPDFLFMHPAGKP